MKDKRPAQEIYSSKHDIPESDKYGGWWLVIYEDGSERRINCEPDRNIVVRATVYRPKRIQPISLRRIEPCQATSSH